MSVQVAIAINVVVLVGTLILGLVGNHLWLLVASGWLIVLLARIARLRSTQSGR